MIPDSNSEYATKQYWENRYSNANDETYDWFKSFEHFKPALISNLIETDTILMLGCGNSALSQDLYDAGFKNIVNVDYIPSVIHMMSSINSELRPEMKWLVADVMDMGEFSSDSFNIAIDKGTMDALMCEQGDVWDPSDEIIESVGKEVAQVYRLLKSKGKFIYITFGQPHFRKPFLCKPEYKWDVDVELVGEAFHYFVYTCTKR